MEELIEMIGQLKELYTFNVTMGVITLVALYVVTMSFHAKHCPEFKPLRYKDIQRAIEMGHVVKGKVISKWEDTDDFTSTDPMSWSHADYSYEVNGISYIYRYMDRASPPDPITLYYLNDPAKTFREKENGYLIGFYTIMLHLIPWVTGVMVTILLGGFE